MTSTRPSSSLEISRRLAVETPEHVVLEFSLAGIGSRAAAAIVDSIILAVLLFLYSFVIALVFVSGSLAAWLFAVWILVGFGIAWGYFFLFEALAGGRTPGKRQIGIRVVMDTGHPVTFSAAAIRNLVRLVDWQPGVTYLLGLIFVFFHSRNKRLGDIVAGTVVVRDRPGDVAAVTLPAMDEPVLGLGAPQLSEEEFRLLARFIDRMESLEPRVRERFSSQLVGRFAERFPRRSPEAETFLVQLYADELARRQSPAAARKTGGVTRASGTAERFVALRRNDWEDFRRRALEAERSGLRRLSGDELVEFAARYREVAADLARARTYGVDSRVLDYLEGIVSAGHNALYGLRGVRRYPIGRLLLREMPAAVVAARRYVLVAFLTFAAPAFVGFTLIREDPQIAEQVLPLQVISRAEAGVEEQARGRGYAEMPSPFLPIVASSIVANNVQVAFAAFAFGVTAGVGTVFVLVFNGLFLGSVLGLFANYGLAGWLLTFVAGHGVLELTAIFIAGGAGLLIGRAVVAPGDLTRRDALVVHGRLAIRLVGASASMLVLAGLIEGLLSASDAPAGFKYGVSAASALLVVLYLTAGLQARRGSAAFADGPTSDGVGAEMRPSRRAIEALPGVETRWAPR